MGTRLYLRTQNPAVLEKLACVTLASCAGFVPLKLRSSLRGRVSGIILSTVNRGCLPFETPPMEEVWDAEFQAVYADDNLSTLDNFLSYGWGKFSPSASDFLCR